MIAGLALPIVVSAATSPKVGTYFGSNGAQKASIEVVKKGKQKKVRLLGLDDTCAAEFLIGPVALGKAGGAFQGGWSGFAHTVSAKGQVRGRFTDGRHAIIEVTSVRTYNGVPTNTTVTTGTTTTQTTTIQTGAQCSLQFSVPLKYLPKVK